MSLDRSYANYNPGGASSPCVSGGGTNRVGSESTKGDGRWGQSDLAGNVIEWTLDSDAAYAAQCMDCAALSGGSRIIRGGSINISVSALPNLLRASERLRPGALPTNHDFKIGVRCARIPDPPRLPASVPMIRS